MCAWSWAGLLVRESCCYDGAGQGTASKQVGPGHGLDLSGPKAAKQEDSVKAHMC